MLAQLAAGAPTRIVEAAHLGAGSTAVHVAALAPAPATGSFRLIWLLIALPLVSSAILLLLGPAADGWGHWLGVLSPVAAFVIGVVQWVSMLGQDAAHRAFGQTLWTWQFAGNYRADIGFLLDPLSMIFVLLILGVGSLIHIYSVGYMAHDPRRRLFFSELNLFVAAMLLLVLGNNFVALYFGWEGVGLASYLLIGFYQDRPSAATAAKKAFIMNRVGDLGLSIAIMIMFWQLNRVDYVGVFAGAPHLAHGVLFAIALLLLLGACGKSGQFPLSAWLPDAMEGPTPVSALIHAATMVTAGAYLIARANPIFNLTEGGRTVVTIVGAITLLYGAVVGGAQDDIKRVLAYSTVSQIGYMFLAVGLGPTGYALGMMHLLGHGFFKANMFLGAGSVMHGMNDQIDIRRFGGLSKAMPVTYFTFLAGYLAIIGFPFFTGFYTKDSIIDAAFEKGGVSGWILGICAMLGVGLTAFYMSRMFFMTFYGERRWTEDVHPHESPGVMTIPMIVLAVLSVLGGIWLVVADLPRFLEPVFGRAHEVGVWSPWTKIGTYVSLVLLALGVAAAYRLVLGQRVPVVEPATGNPVVIAARRRLYVDDVNESLLMRPGQYLTRSLVFTDGRGVDGLVNGLAAMIGGSSGRLRRVQTGFVRSYALSMLGGAAVVIGALLLVRLG